jgi:hypothetical protein
MGEPLGTDVQATLDRVAEAGDRVWDLGHRDTHLPYVRLGASRLNQPVLGSMAFTSANSSRIERA